MAHSVHPKLIAVWFEIYWSEVRASPPYHTNRPFSIAFTWSQAVTGYGLTRAAASSSALPPFHALKQTEKSQLDFIGPPPDHPARPRHAHRLAARRGCENLAARARVQRVRGRKAKQLFQGVLARRPMRSVARWRCGSGCAGLCTEEGRLATDGRPGDWRRQPGRASWPCGGQGPDQEPGFENHSICVWFG